MYRVCLVGTDELQVTIAVLVLIIAGLFVAVGRQTASARKWRELFREACADKRELKRRLSWTQVDHP